MPRQAIEQATCAECGETEENHTVTDTHMEIGQRRFHYETRCACGEEGFVVLDETGIAATGNVNHEGASWNDD